MPIYKFRRNDRTSASTTHAADKKPQNLKDFEGSSRGEPEKARLHVDKKEPKQVAALQSSLKAWTSSLCRTDAHVLRCKSGCHKKRVHEATAKATGTFHIVTPYVSCRKACELMVAEEAAMKAYVALGGVLPTRRKAPPGQQV